MFRVPVMFREENAFERGAKFASENGLNPIEVGMTLGAALVGKHDAVLRRGRSAWKVTFDDGVFTIMPGEVPDTSFTSRQPSLRS